MWVCCRCKKIVKKEQRQNATRKVPVGYDADSADLRGFFVLGRNIAEILSLLSTSKMQRKKENLAPW